MTAKKVVLAYSGGVDTSVCIPYLKKEYGVEHVIAFAADLVPTHGHIPVPYLMSYDVRPLVSLDEKEKFLNYCHEKDVFLFFEHDSFVELGSLESTDRGIRLNNKLKLSEL